MHYSRLCRATGVPGFGARPRGIATAQGDAYHRRMNPMSVQTQGDRSATKTVARGFALALAAVLFSIGLAGVVTKRNILVVMMCVELMLNAANLTFLAFARQQGNIGGHAIAFFVIAVAAAEAAVGLAIVLAIFQSFRTIDVRIADTMRE